MAFALVYKNTCMYADRAHRSVDRAARP
jgi:hypothetical protein